MKRLYKFLLGTAVFIASVIALLFDASWYLDGPMTNAKLESAYSFAAINALTVSSSTAVPSIVYDTQNRRFWSASDGAPCMKTTMEYTLFPPNGRHFNSAGWPSGSEPNCQDFFSSIERQYDPQIAFPLDCYPVSTYRSGPKGSYVIVAANGADMQPLRDASLSNEALTYLRDTDDIYSNGSHTTKFIRAGGLEGVNVELIEEQSCDGFSLFRFQTQIDDLASMRQSMQGPGGSYTVGLK